MLRIALFALLILDCIYQSFGNPNSVSWSIYYELMHYGFAFTVALWSALNIPRMKNLSYIFITYFGIISFKEIFYINFNYADYWRLKSIYAPLQTFSFIAIILIIAFIIFQLTKKKINKNE